MRKPYPADVSDEEWALVAPYLSLLPEDVSQRVYPLREVFNGMRYILKTGAPWRWMPNDLPPWDIVYQQTQRWLKAGVFENMVHDLPVLLPRRWVVERSFVRDYKQPSETLKGIYIAAFTIPMLQQ